MSRLELYEAVKGKPCPWDGLLDSICLGAERKLYTWWTEKGLDDNEYK